MSRRNRTLARVDDGPLREAALAAIETTAINLLDGAFGERASSMWRDLIVLGVRLGLEEAPTDDVIELANEGSREFFVGRLGELAARAVEPFEPDDDV
jgi:hypothetical protein